MPSRMISGKYSGGSGTIDAKSISREKPEKARHVIADSMHDVINAITAHVVNGMAMTSRVNNTPPSGALKMPAIPAPAPIPIIMRIRSGDAWHTPARLLPTAAPV